MEKGYLKGETCNRDGCNGIIEEHNSDGGCSCHINPPCSYCTTSREFCPECDWDGEEEQLEVSRDLTNSYRGVGSREIHDDYREQQTKRIEFDKKFSDMYNGKIEPEKLTIIHESHTHFSMIKKGVFPKGSETKEGLLPQVIGSFGGRWEHFGEFSFKYVAYTD